MYGFKFVRPFIGVPVTIIVIVVTVTDALLQQLI